MKGKTYQGEVEIDYIFKPALNTSEVLVVSFPGIHGGEFAASQLGYNYLMTIGSFNVNALYISNTSKYAKSRLTCINRDFKIERTVKALINQCAKDSDSVRIIVVGSSMGGFCALYYGLKYNWDIIAGALPYSLKEPLEDLMYACGGTGEEDKKWFNEQVYDVVREAGKHGYNKKIFLSWGEGESNWKSLEHGQKLIKDLNEAGIEYTYKLYPYSDHRTVHWLFPNVLKAQLGYYLGLTSEPQDEEQRSDESKLSHELKDVYAEIIALIDNCKESDPDLTICNCVHYGDLNLWTALRNYVYILQGWYWGGGYKEPVKIENKDAFWRELPKEKIAEGVAFWFQGTLLNYYDQRGEEGVLKWCAENARQYLEYICRIADPKHNEHWWNALRRMHFFIDLHRAMAEKEMVEDWTGKIPSEIFRDLRFFTTPDVSVGDAEGQYRRVLGLLHAVVYFRNNTEFSEKLYKNAIDILNKLTNYYFDENGICTIMQVRHQSILAQCLMLNIKFIEDNELPEIKELKILRKRYHAVISCAAHITRPDGVLAALGHSIYEQAWWTREWISRKSGNFIKRTSNIAFLEDEQSLSYITVNGGSNIHSSWKHCDQLSFTWFYDGRQIFLDSEGGNSQCADFARSAIAHNAFICDEIDYITPDYADWTSIHRVDEEEKYVLVFMRHMLIDGVVMKRKLLWVKPNIIILIDSAEADSKHRFAQNFILGDYRVDKRDKSRISIYVQSGLDVAIMQYPAGEKEFELEEYNGTTDVGDTDNMRGSLVSSWHRLRKGKNLVYTKEGISAEFVTLIECHSDKAKDKEVSMKDITVTEDNIVMVFHGGDFMEVNISE